MKDTKHYKIKENQHHRLYSICSEGIKRPRNSKNKNENKNENKKSNGCK